MPNVNIVPMDGEEPLPVNVIERAIVDIASAAKKIASTRLSQRALILLIHDVSKVGKRDIELVLNNLEQLEDLWLKPVKR